jgi:hypothetical protein
MSARPCERGWEVDAFLDERLDAAERAAFERHASSCRACSTALSEGRAVLRAMRRAPDGAVTALEHRRARAALLRRANERLLGAGPLAWPRATWGLGAAAVALSVAYLATRPEAPPDTEPAAIASAANPAPNAVYEVIDEGAARWTATTSDAVTRVSLAKGTATFHVERLTGRARFLVALPDGEIEVRGTRFLVEVEAGRTRRVAVTEGRVELRLGGELRTLDAGQAWPPEAPRASAEDDERRPGSAADPSTSHLDPSRSNATSAAPSASAAASSAGGDAGDTASDGARSLAGRQFAEAMAAYARGEYRAADALFAAFVREHPRDGRAEDATFLRAEGLARAGDRPGAAAAARAYLAAFPRGLRRPEAARLAGLAHDPASSTSAPTPPPLDPSTSKGNP